MADDSLLRVPSLLHRSSARCLWGGVSSSKDVSFVDTTHVYHKLPSSLGCAGCGNALQDPSSPLSIFVSTLGLQEVLHSTVTS